MRINGKLGIPLALMLLGGCGQEPHILANFHEATIDGRLGFKLLLPEPTWKQMTLHPPGMTSVLLDEQIHAHINELIELGIHRRHLPCSHHWLLSQIGPTDENAVLLIGICATAAEMKAVAEDRIANTI